MHTWGTTLAYKLTPTLTLKGGVMEQNPQAASRSHAWSWSTKGSKGVLLPVEIEARPLINGLPGGQLIIHDFGATPGVARIRIEQVFEEVAHA